MAASLLIIAKARHQPSAIRSALNVIATTSSSGSLPLGWSSFLEAQPLFTVHGARHHSHSSSSERADPAAALEAYKSGPQAAGAKDTVRFWGDAAAAAVKWIHPPPNGPLRTDEDGIGQWFEGGKLNTSQLCLDVHVEAGHGDRKALIWDSPVTGRKETFTFSELRDKVAETAGLLRDLGVSKGDTVVVYMPAIPEAVVAMLSCARLGALHSVVFGGFAPHELATRIDDAKPRVLMTARYGVEVDRVIPYKPLVDEAIELAEHKPPVVLVADRSERHCECWMTEGRDFFLRDLLGGSKKIEPAAPVPVDAIDPLYILYTSGTTGKPKGVVRPNGGNAAALLWSMKHIMNTGPGEVYWAASDLGWVVGHSYIVYGPLLAGCTTILYEGKPVKTPDPGAFWRVISEHGVKTIFTAPTAVRAIVREDPEHEWMRGHDVSCLKHVFCAGERLDPSTLHWLEHALPATEVLDNYWQTESGWPICANPAGLGPFPVKAGSAALPMPGYDLRVLDDDGAPVEPGELGNLVLKLPLPPNFLPTLWRDHARMKSSYLERFPGFYELGDCGYMDDDGYVFVMGRNDDVLNVAGHRLSSGAIEEAVSSHPRIGECAVIGVPDPLKAEVPAAFVVLKGPSSLLSGDSNTRQALEREVSRLVREQVGAVSKLGSVVVLDRLPKTRSGKILRKAMRTLTQAEAVSPVPSTIEDPRSLDEFRAALDAANIGPLAVQKAADRARASLPASLAGGFSAVLAERPSPGQPHVVNYAEGVKLQDLPMPDPFANVTVAVKYSTLNYKDGMVMRGDYGVASGYPIVPGIDFAGTVLEAGPGSGFEVGEEVVMTGHFAGQRCDGGFAKVARVRSGWLVSLRDLPFSPWETMAIGTAGFAAMQSVMELERHGNLRRGEELGEVLITGAGGGVGSFAVAILSSLGYSVTASTGRATELRKYLLSLGAHRVMGRLENDRSLQSERWAGAVDTVGGNTLAAVLASVSYARAVACSGVAAGGEVPATVYPFILRGVRLLGIDTVQLPMDERLEVWRRLASDLPRDLLHTVASKTVPLAMVPRLSQEAQMRVGRVVVDVGSA